MIDGKTVHLKPFSLDDTDFLLKWNNDSEYVGEFEPFEPVSRKELTDWLRREKPGQLFFIIETISGEKVGQIVGRQMEDGSYQIGYRMIPSARERGYCTEAARSLIHHLQKNMGVDRITAEVNPRNISSIRVLEKLNFMKISHKKRMIKINGLWLDGFIYELNSEE